MNFWYQLHDKPENDELSNTNKGKDLAPHLYPIGSYIKNGIKFYLLSLLILLSFLSNSQNRTDQILFAIFELHCKQNDRNFREVEYQTFYAVHNNGVLSKERPISFAEAKNKAIKHAFCSHFSENGLCVKITMTDNMGNNWTQEPHYNRNLCTNIYWYKNKKLCAIYKLCHMPDGNCYLTNLINNRYWNSDINKPLNRDIFQLHLSRFPDDYNLSTLSQNYIDISDEIDYDYCISMNKKNKPFKNTVYEYNEHGDWIKLIWYNRKKEPLYITERAISYYTADNNPEL